jgi:hypothetical protein
VLLLLTLVNPSELPILSAVDRHRGEADAFDIHCHDVVVGQLS